jgi:hypothetical protein
MQCVAGRAAGTVLDGIGRPVCASVQHTIGQLAEDSTRGEFSRNPRMSVLSRFPARSLSNRTVRVMPLCEKPTFRQVGLQLAKHYAVFSGPIWLRSRCGRRKTLC